MHIDQPNKLISLRPPSSYKSIQKYLQLLECLPCKLGVYLHWIQPIRFQEWQRENMRVENPLSDGFDILRRCEDRILLISFEQL